MTISANLGFPRMGAHRELKKALEGFWSGKLDEAALVAAGQSLKRNHWQLQEKIGIKHISSNDFSMYDHVLDTAAMLGAVPERYHWHGPRVELPTYFAMARGAGSKAGGTLRHSSESDVPAMEMTKWFDTNYHYIVPEFARDQEFSLASLKPVEEFLEAKASGIITRPVLLGPVSFLLLGKAKDSRFEPLSLLDRVLPIYEENLRQLQEAGAGWVQLDEPMLVLDTRAETRRAASETYERLSRSAGQLQLLVATYFAGLGSNRSTVLHLPVSAVHIDLVRAPQELDEILKEIPQGLSLSLGVIDSRNIWKADLDHALRLVQRVAEKIGSERILLAPSCSLLHCPVDLDGESHLDGELRGWFAFAKQKLEEVALLEVALQEGPEAIQDTLNANKALMQERRKSPRIHDPAVKRRVAEITPEMTRRSNPYAQRRAVQEEKLHLPQFPTTTIGSFPQTKEVRTARAEFKSGARDAESYGDFLRRETEKAVHFQEEIDLDVLVHGEFERNDMVEYFGETLSGIAVTENGWVQSYGSRCVKPPIVYGDVRRPAPMTVGWSVFAQSLTPKPMKGMLTGPVTILEWSFVRDDQPRSETCRQIALAIRDEVSDLEAAGIRVIQIDEPALREGLPLERSEWPNYLEWAVEAFRVASSVVRDDTQIHTHMCYAEFQDIIESVVQMDADVISIETSRSQMELLQTFAQFRYPSGIGPGVYDIHSPRIPTQQEMEQLLRKAATVLSPAQLWVNPDCGLKTRRWEEVRPALTAMVKAARTMRGEVG
ncbi:MAG: 5-methyltetrahydropteroyltriglutamate--homocysteine S-methyltransferase [Candidatus Acidiferrales bacterium]